MGQPSNREIVERYTQALSAFDADTMVDLVAEDVVEEYPQSGERIVGRERWITLFRAWPEHDRYETHMDKIVGSDDQWVAGPSWGLMRITGTGDDFWAHGEVTYSNGETWQVVQLLTLRDASIAHIRSYFAPPFAAAEWRRPYVEGVESEA